MVFSSVVNTDTGQISGCYSIDNLKHKVEFSCNSGQLKTNCISNLFDKNGIFASENSRSEVKQLKIEKCHNTEDYSLFYKLKNVEVLDISQDGLNSLESVKFELGHLHIFNASYNELSDIPYEFSSTMPNIKVIDISHNNVEDIYKYEFKNNNHLTALNISNNKLSTCIISLPENLQELDISNNQIKLIFLSNFNVLSKFKLLNMMNNPMPIDCEFLAILMSTFTVEYSLDSIDEIDFRCSDFYTIKIEVNHDIIFRITNIDGEFRRNKSWFKGIRIFKFEYNKQGNTKALINLLGLSIEHLELTGSYIGHINANKFQEFYKLKTLLLSNTGLDSFCFDYIRNIDNLEILDISRNNLDKIGDITLLSKAINLKKVSVQENRIKNIKEFVGFLGSSMEYLDLSGNNFGAINNQTFKKMNNLTVLNLKETNLINFDFITIGHLNQLQELDISSNYLRNVYSISVLKTFKQLMEFDVSDNKLENIRELIENLPSSLTHLDLSGNYIGELTAFRFLMLDQLTYLKLRRTNLFSFNFEDIEHFINLQLLDISRNSLEKVNFTLLSSNSSSLYEIDLNANQLTELDTLRPEQFPQLSTLKTSNNQFYCKYLDDFKLQWIQPHKSLSIINDDDCFIEEETATMTTTGKAAATTRNSITNTKFLTTSTEYIVTHSYIEIGKPVTEVSRISTSNSFNRAMDRGSIFVNQPNLNDSANDQSSNQILYFIFSGIITIIIVAVIIVILVFRQRASKRYRTPNMTGNSYTEPNVKYSTTEHSYAEIRETQSIVYAYNKLSIHTVPKPGQLSRNILSQTDKDSCLKRSTRDIFIE